MGTTRSHRPRQLQIHLLSAGEKRGVDLRDLPSATDTFKPGTPAIQICGCQFGDSTRSPYSATNSRVDWVR